MVTFRLGPGDCVVFDNTRLLHARTGFADTGDRHLQGCYADLDSIASQRKVLRGELVAERLHELFEGPGTADYLGEDVTQAQHMLQAAALAESDGASPELVIATLLHDVGHFTGPVTGADLMARHRQPAQPRRRRLARALVRPRRHRADPPARRRQALPLRRRPGVPRRSCPRPRRTPSRSRAVR